VQEGLFCCSLNITTAFHLLHRYEHRTWKHGKRRKGKLKRYLIIPTKQPKFQKNKCLQTTRGFQQEEIHRQLSMDANKGLGVGCKMWTSNLFIWDDDSYWDNMFQ
jgi:hypothetical protein